MRKTALARFAAPLLLALLAASAACAQTEPAAPTEIAPAPTATPAPLPPSTECLTEIDPTLVVPKPRPYPTAVPPPPAVPSSLEDLLNSSQVIVRGSASDAEVRTKRVPPSRWDAELTGAPIGRLMPGCAATLRLQFDVTEYLKGSGPDRIFVEDNLSNRYDAAGGSLPYLTDGEARAAAWAWWNAQDGDPRRRTACSSSANSHPRAWREPRCGATRTATSGIGFP